jgi:hypothetical protein
MNPATVARIACAALAAYSRHRVDAFAHCHAIPAAYKVLHGEAERANFRRCPSL